MAKEFHQWNCKLGLYLYDKPKINSFPNCFHKMTWNFNHTNTNEINSIALEYRFTNIYNHVIYGVISLRTRPYQVGYVQETDGFSFNLHPIVKLQVLTSWRGFGMIKYVKKWVPTSPWIVLTIGNLFSTSRATFEKLLEQVLHSCTPKDLNHNLCIYT